MKMFFLIALVSFSAGAETLKLKKFDQYKLAELLGWLDESVVETKLDKRDRVVSMTFPKKPNVFTFECTSEYLDDAVYPTDVKCAVRVDVKNPLVLKKHDTVRVVLKGQERDALFDAIPYGRPIKKFYSYSRNPGVTFTGVKNVVHSYQFLCSDLRCRMTFSKKMLKSEQPDGSKKISP